MTIAFHYFNDSHTLRYLPKRVSSSSLWELFLSDFIVIFHPPGEPNLPHLLCCSAFAVDGPQLHALRLASAATSARK